MGVSEMSYLQLLELFRIQTNAQLLATNKRKDGLIPSLDQLSLYFSKMVKFWFVKKLFPDNFPSLTYKTSGCSET